MLVQLGDDATGRGYVKNFEQYNVGTKHVKLLEGEDTGTHFTYFNIS